MRHGHIVNQLTCTSRNFPDARIELVRLGVEVICNIEYRFANFNVKEVICTGVPFPLTEQKVHMYIRKLDECPFSYGVHMYIRKLSECSSYRESDGAMHGSPQLQV